MSTLRPRTIFAKAHLQRGLRLSDGERVTLAKIGERLGRRGLRQVARIAQPDIILAWYRKLVDEKFDGCKQRRSPGRPRTSPETRLWWFAWLARTPADGTPSYP
jgi:hypothetical protein